MVKLSRIAPEVSVVNLTESIEHYQQKLGFEVTLLMPNGDYAIVERDGVAIHLFHESSLLHTPTGLHIFTDQLEELHEELKNRGARVTQAIERKPWGNREFRVDDPSGNLIKFTEPL